MFENIKKTVHGENLLRCDNFKLPFNVEIQNIFAEKSIVLKFFYETHSAKQRTNPLWP